jgi:adenosylcobyric acid synthase
VTARSIMVLGTGSHVGKSLTTAALCRIFTRAGYRVAPFKAQNMSLNSAATPDGLEIGRAQALQAEAAGIPPSVHMNPILIKPGGDASGQIVVRGRVWRDLDARRYHAQRTAALLPIVEESYRELAQTHDIVVLEGAGSPAEINLKDSDIVNMRMAKLANAPCLLVGDIDRGGVFASLLGTCALLDEEECAMIRGFIINKFRGDVSLLIPGVRMIEERMGKPCLGVVPWLKDLTLDEEDSVGLDRAGDSAWAEPQSRARKLQVAVVALPSISNFTDFASLLAEPSVSLRYIRDPEEVAKAGLVILPGSKQTVQDLRWLRERGFEPALRNHVLWGGLVIGVCGGFQMLGESIHDPDEVECGGDERGMALLPIHTTMAREKTVFPVKGRLKNASIFGSPSASCTVSGYEIHMGQTEYLTNATAFAEITRAENDSEIFLDGCVSPDGRIFGTYLHGIFDGDEFRRALIEGAHAALHLPAPSDFVAWRQLRESEIDRLADTYAEAMNLDAIFELLGLPSPAKSLEVARS